MESLTGRQAVEANQDVDPVLAPVGIAFKKMLRAFEQDTGASASKYFLLKMLARKDGISQGEVCHRFEVDPSRITRLARGLENEGLVRRERDPDDQRVVRLYLTEEGRRVTSELSARRERFERRVREALSEEDVEELRRILAVLTEAMKGSQEGNG